MESEFRQSILHNSTKNFSFFDKTPANCLRVDLFSKRVACSKRSVFAGGE